MRIPQDGIGVEILGGVEPEIELLLSVPLTLGEHVGVQDVRVSAQVAEKLEIDFVMCGAQRRQLQHAHNPRPLYILIR